METNCWTGWVHCLTPCSHSWTFIAPYLSPVVTAVLSPLLLLFFSAYWLYPNCLRQEFSSFSTIRTNFNTPIFPFKRAFTPAKRKHLNLAHQWLQWFKLITGRLGEIYARAFSTLVNTRWWDYTESFHGCHKKIITRKLELLIFNTVSAKNANILGSTDWLKKKKAGKVLCFSLNS